MGSAAAPGSVGMTAAQRQAAEEEAARKKAADQQLYGPDGPGQRAVDNQGDGGWFGGPVGTVTKAIVTSPLDLATHVGGAGVDAVQGNWSGAGQNLVSAGRDAANTASLGLTAPIIGSSQEPNAGLLGPAITSVANGKAPALPGTGGFTTGGSVDQAAHEAVANDVNSVRTGRDDLLAQYKAAAARPVPGLAAPNLGPAAQAAPTTVGSAAPIAATTVGGAAQVGAAPAVSTGQIAPTTIGPAATFSASKVAPTQNATAGQATASAIDTNPQSEFRGDQRDLVQQLKDAAAGNGPSAAQAQLQRANDQAVQQQVSLAAGAHGTSRLTQRLLGAGNIADLEQKNANDSAALKAQEQQQAQGRLQTALDSGRSQDIGLATTGAQLKTDVSKTNAQLATTTSISDADRAAAASMKNAELEQAANSGNAAAINELKSRQAGITSAESIAGAGNTLDASKANAGNAVTTNLANQAAQNRMTELQAQIDAQRGIATAEQQNEMTKLQAQLTSGEGEFNTGQTNDLSKTAAQLTLQANVAKMDAELKARGLDDAQRQSLLDAYQKEQQQALGWDTSQALINANKEEANKKLVVDTLNGFVSGVGKANTLGTALSDKRAKRDIKHVSDAAVAKLADVVSKPKSWRYKGEHDDGNEHFGNMAQDLEKDPLGKKLVHEGADGMKRVDYQGLTALVLAAAIKGRKAVRR